EECGCRPRPPRLLIAGGQPRPAPLAAATARRNRAAVVRLGDEIGARRRFEVERMHEISVLTLRTDREAVEQRMRPTRVESVPAHMRDFQIRIGWRDPFDLTRDPAQSRWHFVFAAAFRHELHADANAEERPAATTHAVIECLHHPFDGIEPAPTIGKRADAWQHHAIGASDLLGIARHHNRLCQSFLARGALERLCRRVQIARPVIDDGDAHRGAPGCGKRPMTSVEARLAIGTPPAGEDGRGSTLDGDLSAQDLLTHASKKRRSADSRSSPTTIPTFRQARRDRPKRRKVEASTPMRSERSKVTTVVAVADASIPRNATERRMATMI